MNDRLTNIKNGKTYLCIVATAYIKGNKIVYRFEEFDPTKGITSMFCTKDLISKPCKCKVCIKI